MKKQKVCALLCVAALSISSVTPAMAADLSETAQVETGTEQQQEVVTEQTDETSAEESAAEEETEGTEDQNTAESPEAAEEGTKEDTAEANQEVPEDSASAQAASENSTDAAAPATESGIIDIGGKEDVIPDDGWYIDENGNTYYYEDGVMLQGTIVEIEDEDGNVYGYYFDENGVMATYGSYYISYYDEESSTWFDGKVYAENNGHLCKGWSKHSGPDIADYYGDDYIGYCNKFLQEGDALYYFDDSCHLVTNQTFIVNGIKYKADKNGVLTIQDTSQANGWQAIDGYWYYYKDGTMLSNTYATINGSLYYFNEDGTMATGVFYDEELGGNRLAEPSGRVVSAEGWYLSPETNAYYWFGEKDIVTIASLETIKGKQYYLDGNGKMVTGPFEYEYEDENGEWVSVRLYADQYGAISTAPGWKLINGTWYYVKENGQAAIGEILDINGKSYYFDDDGTMLTGFIYASVDRTYVADASGALLKNQWVKYNVAWHFTDENGALRTNQWINDTYYVDSSGVMVIGSAQIDGKTYVFDENGRKVAVIGEKNGWQLIEGTWYYAKDGKPYNGWLDHSYYLRNGKMATDTMVPAEHDSKKYTRVGSDGTILSGWILTSDGYCWEYAEKDAKTGDIVLVTNDWRAINGKWYYFEEYGTIVDNALKEIDGKLSRFAAGGAWQGYVTTTGWTSVGGEWYYINSDGTINTEDKMINGHMYYFWGDGSMRKLCSVDDEENGGFYWLNQDGIIDTTDGWKKDSWGNWFYVKNGKLVTGTQVINGTTYVFEGDGCMDNDCIGLVDDTWYLFDADGRRTPASDGWNLNRESEGNIWYYFKNGKPYDGNVGPYYVDFGQMVTNIRSISSGDSDILYMYDDNGLLMTNRWIYRWDNWYYAGATGKLYTGSCTVNGKAYLFNRQGELVK